MFKVKYKKDSFNINSLPKNRKEQFFDILSTHYSTYFKAGLLLVLFALPYILLSIFIPYLLDYIEMTLLENSENTAEMIRQSMLIYGNIFKAIRYISLLLITICLAGLSCINREICFGNGSLFRYDFVKGIKQNSKTYFLVSIIFLSILYLVDFASNSFINNMDPSIAYLLSGLSLGALFIVIAPILMFMLSYSSIYDLPFIYNFINSMRFAYKNILYVLLFMLLPLGIYFLQLIDLIYIRLTLITALIIFIVPLFTLMWHLFSLSRFDIYLNKEHYKTIYKKGLYIEGGSSNE